MQFDNKKPSYLPSLLSFLLIFYYYGTASLLLATTASTAVVVVHGCSVRDYKNSASGRGFGERRKEREEG